MFGISTDSVASQQAFAAENNIAFPLLSDSDPVAAISKAYGVFSYTNQLAQQAVFLIDGNGDILWSQLAPPEISPGPGAVLLALQSFNEGALTVSPDAQDHAINAPAVGLIFVEYGDYQSPECAASRTAVKAMQAQFGTGMTYIYRHFPLARVHPEAQAAAEVAEFAASQGKFWEMHDLLFDNQATLGTATYTKLATSLGLDAAALTAALAAKTFAPNVQADFEGGVRTGVNGVPCFYMGSQYELTIRYDGKVDTAAMIAAMTNIFNLYGEGDE
jgi:protein-disulfide isomerase